MRGVRGRVDRLPIRLRLTVWYAALLIVVLMLFGGALWVGLRIRLAGAFDDQLREQASLTVATVRTVGGTIALDPGRGAAAQGNGSFIRLIAPDGRILTDTGGPAGSVPLDGDDIAAALGGETRFRSVRAGNRPIRVISVPVSPAGAPAGVLQVGMDRGEIDEVMRELFGAISVAAPAAALVALGGGYFLARRALLPVSTISRLAAGISGGNDLHARLGLDLPVDELGELAATFDGMLERIEAAFERQRRFAGDAAHELRTPLALMRGRIDLARDRPRTSEDDAATLDGLDSDLGRLGAVVGALLALARSEAGRLTIEREPFDLGITVGRIADQYAAAAHAAGVTLYAETTPTPFLGDEDLVVQLLVNLVDNALRHTDAGGSVTIGCRAGVGDILLWVADTGIGIDRAHLARVFDRFYRVDAGRARQSGGAGLGLALCRAIAEAHGGAIELDSMTGHGTHVMLRLPATESMGR